MTNFFSSLKLNFSLVCVAAVLCLQGCGGERTTSFNPSASSSSSSSSVTKIETSLVKQDTSITGTVDHPAKSLRVMREYTEFGHLVDSYTNDNPADPGFANGQVVLVDMGVTNACDRHLDFSSLTAQEDGDSSIRVVVKYNERAENRSGCSGTTRPYYFYYVKKRGPVVFEEIIL